MLLVLVILGGVGSLVGSLIGGEFLVALASLILIPFGIIAVRVYCELLILAFRMYDRLGRLVELRERKVGE